MTIQSSSPLDVAVDHPLLVGVLDGLAHRDEQGQAVLRSELVRITVVGDRHTADQLHHEVGAAGGRASRVEHAGDVRVIHQGQRLALGLEPGDDVAGVHPRLQDLERDLAADRLGLLGHEDQAEAPLTDELHQPVGPDPIADFRSRWAGVGRVVRARECQVGRRPVQRVVGGMSREQRLDFAPEHQVPGTRFFQVGRPVGGARNGQSSGEDGFVDHGSPSQGFSSGLYPPMRKSGRKRTRKKPGPSANSDAAAELLPLPGISRTSCAIATPPRPA
jgi:hypothetical protein